MGWSEDQVLAYLPSCFDRDTILSILLGYSGQWFDARMVAITGKRAIQAFDHSSWDELETFDRAELKRQRAILDHGAAVVDGLSRGEASTIGLGPFFDELGIAPEIEVMSLPIPISGRTAIVVIGRPIDRDVTHLEVVCHAIGEQLETVIKMAKSGSLPPEADRVPPFPEPARVVEPEPDVESSVSDVSEARTEIGAPVPRMPGAQKERPQRRTLQSGEFEAPFANDPSKPRLSAPNLSGGHTQNLDFEEDNAPRLGQQSSSSDPSDTPEPGGDASSTMFGLPAYPLGKKSEPEEEEKPSASSTMFGVPGTEDIFQKPKSGVSVLPDRGVGDSPSDGKSTLMGGIEASRELTRGTPKDDELLYDPSVFKSDAELDAERKLEVDEPNTNPNKMTLRGGFEVDAAARDLAREMGEQRAADEAEQDAADAADQDNLDDSRPLTLDEVIEPASIKSLDDDDGATPFGIAESSVSEAKIDRPLVVESDEDEPEPETPKSSLPQAMILRPARKTRAQPAARRGSEASEAGIEEMDVPADYAAASSSIAEEPEASEISEVASPGMDESSVSQTARGVGDIPAAQIPAADDDKLGNAFDQYARAGRGELYESSSHTAIGGAWSPKQNEESAEEGPIDDAWLDYFAPEEEVVPEVLSPESEPAPNRQAGPQTIPPEAIERIMDSGPHIVELQENFMLLDSRDQDRAFQAAHDVATLGEEAIPVLELMFPGRLFVDRYQFTADTLPPVAEHGPVLTALTMIGDPSLYIARKFLDHGVIESRFYAVFLLTQLPAQDVIGDLYERLFDRDVQTRTVARRIVTQYRREAHFDAGILTPLRDELRTDNDDSRIEIAAELLAEFRDVRAVENLLAILGSYQGRANQSLHKALQKITLKSWSSPYEWRQWWGSAKDQKRQTWMVEALNSPSDTIRRMVHEEIQRLPGLDLNYHPDQPAKLRERAQGQLIEWFASQLGRG